MISESSTSVKIYAYLTLDKNSLSIALLVLRLMVSFLYNWWFYFPLLRWCDKENICDLWFTLIKHSSSSGRTQQSATLHRQVTLSFTNQCGLLEVLFSSSSAPLFRWMSLHFRTCTPTPVPPFCMYVCKKNWHKHHDPKQNHVYVLCNMYEYKFLSFFQSKDLNLKLLYWLNQWEVNRIGLPTVWMLSLSVCVEAWQQRAMAAVWPHVLPIWGRNTHGALISNRSSPPLLLMACGSFLLFLLLFCSQSIDRRSWPAPTARCQGREVIGVVCGCVCLYQTTPVGLCMQ